MYNIIQRFTVRALSGLQSDQERNGIMTVINDSITLHYIPMKKLKTSTVGVYIHRPLTKEEASFGALLPSVLKRGCSLCKTREELEKYLDSLYGADLRSGCFKKGEDQILYFTLESISEKYTPEKEPLFEKLTALIMSILFEPVVENGGFSQEYTEQEKKNLTEKIEGMKNDKRTYASMRCTAEMFEGTDYAVPSYGAVEDVKKIDCNSLYEYYKRIIFSSRIDIYISGDCDENAACALIKNSLPHESFSGDSVKQQGMLVKNTEVKYVEEKLDVTQGKLSMGFTTGIDGTSEDYYALMVANSIFGGGAHSKLFNNVREKLSLCYYASSSLERYKSVIIVNAGIEFENYQKAYDEILNQLKAVQEGDISQLEYISSINAIVNSLKSCLDDQYAMQSFSLSESILKTGVSLEECIEKIKKVTVSDAVRAAAGIRLDTVYFLKGADTE